MTAPRLRRRIDIVKRLALALRRGPPAAAVEVRRLRQMAADYRLIAASRFFDSGWYLAANPDVAATGVDPLDHFLQHGAAERRRASPRFDTAWYLEYNADVARSGINPLAHFLRFGEQEGRAPSAAEMPKPLSRPVTDAAIECRRAPGAVAGQDVALFVTHSPDGELKPHVAHHLSALRRAGVRTLLIVAADNGLELGLVPALEDLEGLYVRENIGFDFAAWAHVLQLEPSLFAARTLILVNDSVIGPIDEARYGGMLEQIRHSEADVIGMTDNDDRGWHIQSYFLAFRARALSSFALHRFINGIASVDKKEHVINLYEIRLASTLRKAGLRTEVFFPGPGPNRVVFAWRDLIRMGFPFLKVSVPRGTDRASGVDASGWQDELASRGFDLSLAQAALDTSAATPTSRAPAAKQTFFCKPARKPSRPPRVTFIGPWNYMNGLGIASRGYVSALWHSGMQVRLCPIRRPFHVHGRVAPMADISDFSGPPDVMILHLNPDSWPHILTDEQLAAIRSAPLRVGLWVWEMAEIPPNWQPVFDSVDAIWAPSRFCADLFAAAAKVPVEVVPHTIAVDPIERDPIRTRRLLRHFGVPEKRRIVLFAFDSSSYIVRKNPAALVRAFGCSGLAFRGWTLVLKTRNLLDQPEAGRRLLELVQQTSDVVLLNNSMARGDMDGLLRAADIYASPHCSEGFGLTIAEAMAFGKSVVATDYGGSRDFLDESCGFPVPARGHRLDRDHGHYKKGGLWAEVDEGALADALRAAAAEVEAGDRSKGERARRRIQERLSAEAVGRAMREQVEQLLQAARAERGLQ